MKTTLRTAIVAFAMSAMAVTVSAQTYQYPFQNPKLSVEERTENLISLLTPK